MGEMGEGSLRLTGIHRWMGLSRAIRRQEREKDVCGGSMCAWQVRERIPSWSGSGVQSQCPPLAAVVATHAGLSGKVHHVVLFAGAARGGQKHSERGRGESVSVSDREQGAQNPHRSMHTL